MASAAPSIVSAGLAEAAEGHIEEASGSVADWIHDGSGRHCVGECWSSLRRFGLTLAKYARGQRLGKDKKQNKPDRWRWTRMELHVGEGNQAKYAGYAKSSQLNVTALM